MKAIISGGAGFIGSHTVEHFLAEGAQVAVIDNLSQGRLENLPPDITLYREDIRDAAAMQDIFGRERPDTLVHLAAQILPASSVADPANDAEINIVGSLRLFEAARQNGLKRIVYASSAAVFGEPQYLPIDEEHPLEMLSGYGASKHTVEHYLRIYHHLYGIGFCALRYGNVYGPRQGDGGEGGVVSIFSGRYQRGELPIIFGDGTAIRDFVYVKDVAKANYLAATARENGIFNVCTNTQTTINELVEHFNGLFGKKLSPIYQPNRPGDIHTSYMCYDKIAKALGWQPAYRLKQGLGEMLKGVMAHQSE